MLKKEIVLSYDLNMKIDRIAAFSMEAGRFQSRIEICYKEKIVDAKSVLGMLSLVIPSGAPFELCIEGADEEKAMAVLQVIFENFLANK